LGRFYRLIFPIKTPKLREYEFRHPTIPSRIDLATELLGG